MSEARSAMLDDLRAIVGAAQVLVDPDALASYRQDGRGEGGGVPMAVVRPADAGEVSALVRFCARSGLRMVVQGARTGLVGAGLAGEGDLVLNLDRLSRHIEIDPVNRTATVDAGVRLSALNEAAGAHGLFLPVDLGADPSIGGMVAANTGGARLLRYGDMRANLMALDVVLADAGGECVTLGAPLWKNNTGVDLKQLLVGSSGSMGVVTRVTVALQPRPAVQLTALLALRDPHLALDLLLGIEGALGTLLSAFEGMGTSALDAVAVHIPRVRMPFAETPAYAVLIELSAGAAIEAEWLEERLADAIAPFMEGEDAPVLDVAIDHRDGLWAIRHAVPEGLRTSGTVVACDIALKRGDVMRFREDVAARLAAEVPELIPHDFGHIGDGGLHYNCVWPKDAGPVDPAKVERAREIIFDAAVREYGGSFSAEHGIGPRNIDHYPRFVAPALRDLAGKVQHLVAPVTLGRVDFGMD